MNLFLISLLTIILVIIISNAYANDTEEQSQSKEE